MNLRDADTGAYDPARFAEGVFTPAGTMDVLDQHGGFTALTPKYAWGTTRLSHYETLWRPGDVAKQGTTGALVPGTVKRDDFYQLERPVISAEYKLPGYRYRVKVWFRPDGSRIA
jgi:hypothetical protein